MPYVDKVTVDNTTYDIRDTVNANEIKNIESFFPHDGGAGAIVTVNGTVNMPLAELVVYGKSTQAGTPSPSSPVNIVTAGSSGTLSIVVTDGGQQSQTVALPTPNGLPGVAVSSGGNYTDTDGQQWWCDTIDLAAGTYTKRMEVYTVTGSESVSKSSESTLDTYLMYFPTGTPSLAKGNITFLCSHFRAAGTTAIGNAEIPTTGNYLRMRCHYASAGTSTVADFKAAIAGMTVVYALATPVVTPLTEVQLTALRSLRGKTGTTNIYSTDTGEPEIRAELYIDIPTYIDSIINKE